MPSAAAEDAGRFVTVYDRATGREQDIPAEWLGNPVLSKPFRKTPLSADQQREADARVAAANPDESPAAGGQE